MSKEVKKFTAKIIKKENNFLIKKNNEIFKTPEGNLLSSPYRKIAQFILSEINQNNKKEGENNIVTYRRITNLAIDKINKDKNYFIKKIVNQVHSDTLCYFTSDPKDLLQQQINSWKPLLEWINNTYMIKLSYTCSLKKIIQDKKNVQSLNDILITYDEYKLSCISTLCQVTGSLVIALALCDSRINYEEAFRASKLEELYQLSKWGNDSEASNRREAICTDIYKASRYLTALKVK